MHLIRRDGSVPARRIPARRLAVLALSLGLGLASLALARPAAAQEPAQREGRGQFANMQRVTGEVTAVNGATLTVKAEDGAVMQVVTTDNTRVMKGRGVTVKVADLKPGDGVVAAGILDAPNKTLHAAFVIATDAAQVAAMKANLGKTYIVGRVTAIDLDNARLTVERPDHVSQTIGFDDGTSFRRGRARGMAGMGFGGGGGEPGQRPRAEEAAPADSSESITLADVKVGDNVMGQGTLKSGVFVPKELTVSTPRPRPAAKP